MTPEQVRQTYAETTTQDLKALYERVKEAYRGECLTHVFQVPREQPALDACWAEYRTLKSFEAELQARGVQILPPDAQPTPTQPGPQPAPGEAPGQPPHPSTGNLTVEGERFSASEREVAQELANRGHTVILREADPSAPRTSDLVVDGKPYDVYTPTTGNIDRIVGAIADKGSQVRGGGVVIDLRQSPLTPDQLGDLLPRVRGITDQISDIIVIK